jgi:hypothetical protein
MLPGAIPLPPLKTPREQLEAAMSQARTWSVDPTTPPAVRRKLKRSVAAYDAARVERAEAAQLRADFEALKAKAERLRAEAKAERLKERRAEARQLLARAGYECSPRDVDRYLATGAYRQKQNHYGSIGELYARSR